MTFHEFNHARWKIENERFAATEVTTFAIAIERTHFEEKQARRLIKLTEALELAKPAAHIRGIQERKITHAQQNRLRLQRLKYSAREIPHSRTGIHILPSVTAAQPA